jgi:hypothetical protein
MASNENDAQINNAILNLVHRGRGHGPLGKKMILPKPEGEAELALRPSKEPPPGYEDETPPYYDGKGKEPSSADKASVAEKKAPVAAEKAPVVPEEAPAPLKPPHPLLPPQEDRSHLCKYPRKPILPIRKTANTVKDPDPRRQVQEDDEWARQHGQDRAGGRAGHQAVRRTHTIFPFYLSRETNTLLTVRHRPARRRALHQEEPQAEVLPRVQRGALQRVQEPRFQGNER